jgi:hypothetical protein
MTARTPAALLAPRGPSRYFTDTTRESIYLTGSHTWSNFQDRGASDPPSAFDYVGYLDWLVSLNHNYIRLWVWEEARRGCAGAYRYVSPNAYLRTGPGLALDGKPRFDLDRFNPAYFARLRERILTAGRRGLYVSVMLFQGWSGRKHWDAEAPILGHPYHVQNNTNGLDGGRADGLLIDLDASAVRLRDAAYLEQVVSAVRDLPNVLFEVANEGGTRSWNRFVLRSLQELQQSSPIRHPIGLTAHGGETTSSMHISPADWLSPGCLDVPSLYDDPPVVEPGKIQIIDSDHLWGVGGDHRWVWKCFCRGYNVIFMDPYLDSPWSDGRVPASVFGAARSAMGQVHALAQRLPLETMAPASNISSRYFCLADVGHTYVVYLPEGGFVMLDLTDAEGELEVEWIHPLSGARRTGELVTGGRPRTTFWSTVDGDAVLHLRLRS